MKTTFLIITLCSLFNLTFGQSNPDALTGKVSYISSQNIYVKFETTHGIHIGDTLYVIQNNKKTPVIIVSSLSSISCVGSPISTISLSVSDKIFATRSAEIKSVENSNNENKLAIAINDQALQSTFNKQKLKDSKERFDGRISINSYSNISSIYPSNERLRYNLSLNAEHIGNSNLSAESYITFTHMLSFPKKTTDWTGLNNALKIYNLSLKYELSKTANISFGRKIYNNMANIGAVDGFEFEKVSKNFIFGALVGSRPDYLDYSFNLNLLQFGAFVSHNIQNENGNMQTSVAIFNQMNNFKTDRRFVYIQHSNSILKNVDFFSSFEIDLYGSVNNQLTNTFDLTSTFLSLRYKPWKKLSFSLSYDARKNIYYYETFKKNKLDSIYDKETRQGLRFQTVFRPFKNIVWGGNAGYRLPENTDSTHIAAMNGYTYLTFLKVPYIDASATLSATAISSKYIRNMTVYEISLTRDFFKGNVNVEVEYRLGNYQYRQSALPATTQNIAAMSIFWRVAKKLMLSANIEATFEKSNNYGSIYLNIGQRF